MADDLKEATRALRQWAEGDGQAILGGALKAGAQREQGRLMERLETVGLFPHLEHEDRIALEKAQRAEQQGQSMVDCYRRRRKAMKGLRSLVKTEQ